MTTITRGASTITPELVLGYSAVSQSNNVFHKVIGRDDSSPDVSLAADDPRSGKLEFFFLTAAAAWDAHALHKTAGTFTLTDADIPQLDMLYVRNDDMSIRLDDETREYWVLTVGFQEVLL